MSSARVGVEMRVEGRPVPATRVGGGVCPPRMEEGTRLVSQRGGEGSAQHVLEPDRMPRTLVIVLHEEAVNQFLGMAYYGGMFSRRELSVRAINFGSDPPFPVRATLDVAGVWRLRGFSRFSIVHLVFSYIRQYFGQD
jgi:hypothetical protein